MRALLSLSLAMEDITKLKLLFSLFIFSHIAISSSLAEEYKTYIIHMDKSMMSAHFGTHHSWYTSMLSTLSSPEGIEPTHLYTYSHVMDGFSAVLSQSQLDELERMPGLLVTYPESYGKAHTTHSPQFLGLKKHSGLWEAGWFGDDMIIGILDTGIWPESESFKDHGMPPVPERWRGHCETGVEFNTSHCNRKLIGARSFSKGMRKRHLNISTTDDYDSPRDYFGHGTHTSSTAAGNRVSGANYFGYAKGTASGVAPLARLAMYKVLFLNDTYDSAASDVLAGMDQAIEDGVDLMSLSLSFVETPFYKNPVAIGAFAAMEKGIFVSTSAGNAGPHSYTIHNGAPWITTVGAGSIDREYAAQVTLGEHVAIFTGKSGYPANLLVSGAPLYHGNGNKSKEICDYLSLDPEDVSGKIIFCKFNNETNIFSQWDEVNRVGATGAIFASDSAKFIHPDEFSNPYVIISPADGYVVEKYIKNTAQPPTVDIKFQITLLGVEPAPQVAYFSSRGPNHQSPWVLKPDILAPGVHILAAWVPNRGFANIGHGKDLLLTDYAVISGTSMASPHIVGIAALLKSAHRDWSSAAIRSAMMTTADVTDNSDGTIIDMITGMSGSPIDFGAGHVNPNKALDPGLVYDIEARDYVNFMCALNYTSEQIKVITRKSNYSCSQANLDLNYPSFIVLFNGTNTTSFTFKRVLTNVGAAESVYRAVLWHSRSMKVVVEPMTLSFGGKNSKAEFTMTVESDMNDYKEREDDLVDYGYLSWYEVNGKHVVRSPIVSAFVYAAKPLQKIKPINIYNVVNIESARYGYILHLSISNEVIHHIHVAASRFRTIGAYKTSVNAGCDQYWISWGFGTIPVSVKHSGLWKAGGFGDDMIIGILDVGIWPESESFKDYGMPLVPERWRGHCENGSTSIPHTNRKLIGASSFSKGMKKRYLNISATNDYDSPRDYMGNGTHTSSSAAGSKVSGANYFGYAKGAASGVAPLALLSMYKVLFLNDTYESEASDVLVGIDQAIEDGVDLMSLSLNFIETLFYENPIAIGAFAALAKGIYVSTSTGNAGTHSYTIHHGAPWITTVGAGTIDREYTAQVTLGEHEVTFMGKSIYPEDLLISGVPIYYGKGNTIKEYCDYLYLEPEHVLDKIVFCNFTNETVVFGQLYKIQRVRAAGGILVTDDPISLRPHDFNTPYVAISSTDRYLVHKYVKNAGDSAKVDIKFLITVLGYKPAPQAAYFSSRGPNHQAPWVLKPDILAPGVDILAAWVPRLCTDWIWGYFSQIMR
ncbi:hypothetical protein GIB67_017573 [Kingdonia uniflora]|uniref:Uncharacterized protein n=1 Tax=Kingdonia uniflora TaxID=39325 RepID=A0A7J7LMR3_9MAGN|nr:hypothetical protein GIB67_017573 [Kingdonia uniflora]